MRRVGWWRTVRWAALGVVALTVVALTVVAMSVAFAASPPTPTILSGPSAPTTSTSATFTYKDSQAGVRFQCALDGGAFSACAASGKTYTGLADGPHRFAVRAQSGSGVLSASATRAWSVDRTAPAITLSFPVDSGVYNLSGWNAACSTPTGDVCGTASDTTGVQKVRVAILQWSTLRYWNGTSFGRTGQLFNTATGPTSWRYPLPLTADGFYTVFVQAIDTLGNQTPILATVVATFRIDVSPPPAPTITQKPTDPTTATTATFKFSDSEPGVGFRCALDGGPAAPCNSRQVTYTGLSATTHSFSVRAVDPAGNPGAPALYSWTVQGSHLPFTIAGQATQALHPGGTSPVNLVFTNPNGIPIQITGVTVTVARATTHPGCDGSANFQVTKSLTATPTVPANSTVSLSALGVPQAQWPRLLMLDLPTNQDACKNTTFTLTYTGTATGS